MNCKCLKTILKVEAKEKRTQERGKDVAEKKSERYNNKVMRRKKKRSRYSSSSNDGHALKQLGKIIIYVDDGQSTWEIEEEDKKGGEANTCISICHLLLHSTYLCMW